MYKLHLILKYLLKRRIAWVSLLAVMLCTTMVIVVISVMGGWLIMFRQSFHGLSGDITVNSQSLSGFPYYKEMIRRLEKSDGIAAAVPVIETYGLLSINNNATAAVQVMGMPMAHVGEVNRFPQSLYRQHTEIEDELKALPAGPSPERSRLETKLTEKASFDLIDRSHAPLASLPTEIKIDDPATNLIAVPQMASPLWYDATGKQLVYRGIMTQEQRDLLRGLSEAASFKASVDNLFTRSNDGSVIDYPGTIPGTKQDVTRWPGMIPGIGVAYVWRDKDGNWQSQLGRRKVTNTGDSLYRVPVRLTVLGINQGEGVDLTNKTERNYWIVDTSRTQVWQYDNKTVYVPFEQLQLDLGMGHKLAHNLETGAAIELPARTSEVHIRVKPGVTLDAAEKTVIGVIRDMLDDPNMTVSLGSTEPYVRTWEESQRTWLNAIENEKLMMVILFGIISVVAVFLIFCIFYMIVVEKTRDIGIIKSVGATSTGVAVIFLGYGMVIGIIGAGMGLLVSYLIIHNINELHTELGKLFGIQIWNPEVYMFDKIPNTINPHDVIVICSIAVLSSVLGALVPALRAASLNPVEALRWE